MGIEISSVEERARVHAMTGNRTRFASPSISDTGEHGHPHNPTDVPRRNDPAPPGSASRPSPLRGSTSGRVWTPTPHRRLSAPSRERGPTGHKPSGLRG